MVVCDMTNKEFPIKVIIEANTFEEFVEQVEKLRKETDKDLHIVWEGVKQ